MFQKYWITWQIMIGFEIGKILKIQILNLLLNLILPIQIKKITILIIQITLLPILLLPKPILLPIIIVLVDLLNFLF